MHSDDNTTYIRRLSIFTCWTVIFEIGCGVMTFLPYRYICMWILSSIPFYVYLNCSYMNYLFFYERVGRTLKKEVMSLSEQRVTDTQPTGPSDMSGRAPNETPPAYADIAAHLADWTANNGCLHPGLTIQKPAEALHTNRPYLSGYIRSTCHLCGSSTHNVSAEQRP